MESSAGWDHLKGAWGHYWYTLLGEGKISILSETAKDSETIGESKRWLLTPVDSWKKYADAQGNRT